MNKHGRKLKKIIKYLIDIYNKEDLSSVNQDLFLSKPELDKLLNEYYLKFKNKDEKKKAIAHNLEILDKLSFGKYSAGFNLYKNLDRDFILNLSKLKNSKDSSIGKTNGGYIIIKDGKDPKHNSSKKKLKLNLLEQEHLQYASSMYHYLKNSFINKLREEGIDVSYNPYPKIFKSGTVYNKFLAYTENHIIDSYLDYSYLKKRLEHDDLIHRIKDNDFMRILFEDMNLINEKEYDRYLQKNKLTSLGKSQSENRVNNYNNIFLS